MTTKIMEQQSVEAFALQGEIAIAAPIEVAFQAVLDELGPEAKMGDGKSLSLKIEPWPGGRWYRDLGNHAGHLWGHVQVIKPPTLLEICGPMPMSYPAINHLQYRLKAEGAGTLLLFTHRAMGLIQPEHRDGMSKGMQSWLEGIRELAERRKNLTGKK